MKFAPDRLTVSRLMAIVGLLAVLLAAGIYRRENADVDQAMISRNLRATASADPDTRRWAGLELGNVRTGNLGPIASALARLALGDPVAQVRGVGAQGLARVLVAVAQQRRERERAASLAAPTPPGSPGSTNSPFPPLGDSGDEAEMVGVLLRALGDPQAEARRAAAAGLDNLLRQVRLAEALEVQAVPRINRLLADDDSSTRSAAISALAGLGAPPEEGRSRAIALLERDPDQYVRLAAAWALVHAWPSPELYAILLARHDRATDPQERSQILLALTGLNVTPPVEAIPLLIPLMKAGRVESYYIPHILGKLGKGAAPYLGRLGELAESERLRGQSWVWFQMVYAMAGIDPFAPEAQAVLLGPVERMLREHPPEIDWRNSIESLVRAYGAAAAPLVPSLRAMLKDPDADDRHLAATCLGTIGRPAVEAIPDLEALGRGDSDSAARWALVRLRRLQPQPTPPDDPAP